MGSPLHNELRKEFQLERLILFSDAVFAIAITLLVIEIKIPGTEELRRMKEEGLLHSDIVSDNTLIHALWRLIPKFIGFLISFMIIGQYWMVHHRMFGFVVNFNARLIWLNLFFLFGIALMPFSTGFYSDYAGMSLLTPVIFYTGNITLLGILNFSMWYYLGNPKHKLTENLSPQLARYNLLRSVTVPVIFIICSIVYIWSPVIAAFIPATIPIIMRLIFKPMKKKLIQPSN